MIQIHSESSHRSHSSYDGKDENEVHVKKKESFTAYANTNATKIVPSETVPKQVSSPGVRPDGGGLAFITFKV